MHLDLLKNKLAQVFGAEQFFGAPQWTHGATKYRLECYTEKQKPRTLLDDFYVYETSLYFFNEHTNNFEILDKKQWDPKSTPEQVVLWVTEIILTHDATT